MCTPFHEDYCHVFVIFLIANSINLLMAILFVCRKKGLERAEYFLGLIIVATILPLMIILVLNLLENRELWFYLLIIPIILFLLVEWVLDYLLKIDFRNTSIIWPYISLYYLALMGLIGYSFLVNKIYGFITLSTYFLNLFATWYGHSKWFLEIEFFRKSPYERSGRMKKSLSISFGSSGL